MYRPPPFREDRPEILGQVIAAHPLALLVTSGESGIQANLVPFLLDGTAGPGGRLLAHIARANPQLPDLRSGAEALVIFQGPQAYVSPNWYPTKHQHGKAVPTWNYVMVQARGRPKVTDDAGWLKAQVDALTRQQEQDQPRPWSMADAPPDYIDGQVRGIAGVEIEIERLEGKWKASQNQPEPNRAGVIAGLTARHGTSPMALIMESLTDPQP